MWPGGKSSRTRTRSPGVRAFVMSAGILAEAFTHLRDLGVDFILGEHTLIDQHAGERRRPALVIGQRVVDVMAQHLDITAVLIRAPVALLRQKLVHGIDLLF